MLDDETDDETFELPPPPGDVGDSLELNRKRLFWRPEVRAQGTLIEECWVRYLTETFEPLGFQVLSWARRKERPQQNYILVQPPCNGEVYSWNVCYFFGAWIVVKKTEDEPVQTTLERANGWVESKTRGLGLLPFYNETEGPSSPLGHYRVTISTPPHQCDTWGRRGYAHSLIHWDIQTSVPKGVPILRPDPEPCSLRALLREIERLESSPED